MQEPTLPILMLSQSDLEEIGLTSDPAAVVADVKRALVDHGSGATISEKVALSPSRERTFNTFGADDSVRDRYSDEDLDVKLSALNSINHTVGSVKIIGANALNRERGLPRSEALIALYAVDTLRPTCLMRGTQISALRTGAYAAVVGEYLLPKEKDNIVGYIGSGKMAETSVQCMDATIADKIGEIRIYSRTRENAEDFVRRMQPETGMRLSVAHSIDEAVGDADYVVTATTALAPLVDDPQLKRNSTVLLLGGDELGPRFIGRCSERGLLFCDDWELVKHRNVQSLPLIYHKMIDGDTSLNITVNEDRIHNLYELITGTFDLRSQNYECVHVNCVGLPDLDLVVAERMYNAAKEMGLGTTFSL